MAKRKHRSEQHWLNRDFGGMPGWGLVLSGLFMVGVAGVWVWSESRPEPVPQFTALPQVSATPSASVEPPVAVFLGDSYTSGTGSSADSLRWSAIVSDQMGWDEANFGRGGTGYATAAGFDGCGREECPAYPARVAEIVQSGVDPAFVFIAGGQNDSRAWTNDSEAVTLEIDATFERARAAFPDAEIVAVGPSWLGDINDWRQDFDVAVQTAAARVGATYVSLIDPPVIDTGTMDAGDGAHVNDAGHAAIADRVLGVLG